MKSINVGSIITTMSFYIWKDIEIRHNFTNLQEKNIVWSFLGCFPLPIKAWKEEIQIKREIVVAVEKVRERPEQNVPQQH